MSENTQKTPASRMVRVSSPLIPYVQKLSDLHRQGHTEAIINGLETLISGIENNAAISQLDSDLIASILRRLEALEAASSSAKQPESEPTQAPSKQSKSKPKQPPEQSRKSGKLQPEPRAEPSVEARVEKTIPRLPRLFCPKCNSTDLKRWGHNQDKTKQKYKCANCGKQFFK
ncbi:hypothetical protein CAL7716_107810 (plasmid) [Calothrix sp. PCC 7716]|nr:hypothetical protein CAL7716_107810 [Calothrix sp. PCC 7716]